MKTKKIFLISLIIIIPIFAIFLFFIINNSNTANRNREISVTFKKEATYSQIMEAIKLQNIPTMNIFFYPSAVASISPDRVKNVIQNLKQNKAIINVSFNQSLNEIITEFDSNTTESEASQILATESLIMKNFNIDLFMLYNIPEKKVQFYIDEFKKMPFVKNAYLMPLMGPN